MDKNRGFPLYEYERFVYDSEHSWGVP
jgi:hypothetical protein